MIENDDLQGGLPERLISPVQSSPQEENIERALRPKRLDEYVGQEKIRSQLSIFIEAAKRQTGQSA